MTKFASSTPIRRSLIAQSALHSNVEDGLNAVKNAHRDYLEPTMRGEFADSIDIDEAFKFGRENENRWDYLLGHEPSGEIIALEPHSAKNDEISTVIRKKHAAREQLQGHLRNGAKISKWLWVASGTVHFANTEKTKFLLDQNGIEFVGKKVLKKHLPLGISSGQEIPPRKKRK